MNQPGAPRVINGLHHVVLAVADLAAAERCYAGALGLLARGDGWLQGPNAALRLVPGARLAAPLGVNVAGIVHICVQSAEMPRLFEKWQAAGGGANSPPVDLGTGYRYCYARDAESHVCELEQVPTLPDGNKHGAWSGASTWLAHAAVAVLDIDRACNFYGGLLGADVVRSPLFQNNPRMDRLAALPGVKLQMAWLDAGNQQIELIRYVEPATMAESPRRAQGAGGWRELVFEAEDVAAALARVAALGGHVMSAEDGEAFDPEGNTLRFVAAESLRRAGHAIAQMPDPMITRRFAAGRQTAAAQAAAREAAA